LRAIHAAIFRGASPPLLERCAPFAHALRRRAAGAQTDGAAPFCTRDTSACSPPYAPPATASDYAPGSITARAPHDAARHSQLAAAVMLMLDAAHLSCRRRDSCAPPMPPHRHRATIR